MKRKRNPEPSALATIIQTLAGTAIGVAAAYGMHEIDKATRKKTPLLGKVNMPSAGMTIAYTAVPILPGLATAIAKPDWMGAGAAASAAMMTAGFTIVANEVSVDRTTINPSVFGGDT